MPAPSGSQRRLLATLSHELRTPLNVVLGYSDAIAGDLAGVLTRSQIGDYATAIHEAGRQLLGLVDAILDYGALEAGEVALAADLIQVDHMVAAVTAAFTSTALQGQVSLTSAASPLPLMRADERRLRKALDHVLGNAIKFTPAGGTVRIAARQEGRTGDLLIMVSDTGIGIAPEDVERAFEPFVQLDSTLARRFPGAGLGLYVARTTMRAHGGELILSSVPGEGTTAVLRLPSNRLVRPHQARPEPA